MLKKTIKKTNKLIFSIILFLTIGIIIGVITTNNLKGIDYEIVKSDKSYLEIFLNSFSLNYWYLFIIWFFGLVPIGFIIDYFIVFFKGYILGITIGVALKSVSVIGIFMFLKFSFLEILIIIPTLIYLANKSIKNSFVGRRILEKSNENYFNVLVKVTIIIIIFAILTCIKFTTLEAQTCMIY